MANSRKRRRSRSSTMGFIFIVLGVLLLLDQMDIMDFGDFIQTFWPLILVYFGIKMIFFPKGRHEKLESQATVESVEENGIRDETRLFESKLFGEIRRVIRSHQFAGGKFSATFGDIDIDASEMKIRSGQRTLYCSTVFGDIRLHLPDNTPFFIRASCTAGEVDIRQIHGSGLFVNRSFKTDDFDAAATRIIIVISVVFGDIKIW